MLHAKDFKNAEACYLFALGKTKKPNRAPLHHNLGGVYLQTGEYKKAAGQFRQALEINPNYEVWLTLFLIFTAIFDCRVLLCIFRLRSPPPETIVLL